MTRIVCGLEVWSDKTIDEVAQTISRRVLGGVRFVGKDEFIRDEVPAVSAENDILGLRVILMGGPVPDCYYLGMEPSEPSGSSPADEIRESRVDISGYVGNLLQGVEGLTVAFKGF